MNYINLLFFQGAILLIYSENFYDKIALPFYY